MTRQRPPGSSRSRAAARPTRSCSVSSFTAMRMAWKTRRAGWPPVRRVAAGMALRTISASSVVVAMGRAATMARAMRRAKRPSPFSANKLGQGALVEAVDHVRRAAARGRVHAHVEWRLAAVGEASFRDVELWRRHAEVEDHAREPWPRWHRHSRAGRATASASWSNRRRLTVARSPKVASAVAGGGDGRRVPVEAEHLDVGMPFEEGAGMARRSHGGVDDQAGRDGTHQVDHLGDHDRLVREVLAHPQSPDRHDACGWSAATIQLEVCGGGFFQWSDRGTAHGPDTFDMDVVTGNGGETGLERGRAAASATAPLLRRRAGRARSVRSTSWSPAAAAPQLPAAPALTDGRGGPRHGGSPAPWLPAAVVVDPSGTSPSVVTRCRPMSFLTRRLPGSAAPPAAPPSRSSSSRSRARPDRSPRGPARPPRGPRTPGAAGDGHPALPIDVQLV